MWPSYYFKVRESLERQDNSVRPKLLWALYGGEKSRSILLNAQQRCLSQVASFLKPEHILCVTYTRDWRLT